MALDLSASFLLVSDIKRNVLYVMHIEQENLAKSKMGIEGGDQEPQVVSKVSSITQLLLPFSAISLAIREATMKVRGGGDEDFEGEEKANRVSLKMLVVQPKSLQKCKAVFELGTSVPLGEGFDPSCSTINTTTSDYEPTVSKASTSSYFNLLTPDAFVSPAKGSGVESSSVSTTTSVTPGSPLARQPPVTPNEMLALSSPRRPTPEAPASAVIRETPPPKRNGIQSGGSSPSREVEQILGARPMTEGSIESDGSNTVPTGPALQDALSAYPPSLSPAFVRAASSSSKEAPSPAMESVQLN